MVSFHVNYNSDNIYYLYKQLVTIFSYTHNIHNHITERTDYVTIEQFKWKSIPRIRNG